mmetsp:Transcript_25678/g.59388  ORF Transcript_25678/g.59388 Transcript_25678/m.59388 type:complete len:274 (-) Transcript_25678:49-870(-)
MAGVPGQTYSVVYARMLQIADRVPCDTFAEGWSTRVPVLNPTFNTSSGGGQSSSIAVVQVCDDDDSLPVFCKINGVTYPEGEFWGELQSMEGSALFQMEDDGRRKSYRSVKTFQEAVQRKRDDCRWRLVQEIRERLPHLSPETIRNWLQEGSCGACGGDHHREQQCRVWNSDYDSPISKRDQPDKRVRWASDGFHARSSVRGIRQEPNASDRDGAARRSRQDRYRVSLGHGAKLRTTEVDSVEEGADPYSTADSSDEEREVLAMPGPASNSRQ